MEKYKFLLTAANRKAKIDFSKIEEEYSLFTKASSNCNAGVTFKRSGKAIAIEDITSESITLTLSSASALPSPTRTLSAYSRELIRINKETNVLSSSIYNHTLFNTTLIETIREPQGTIDEISDTELLKAITDLLFAPSGAYNTNQKRKTINKIKELMLPYIK